MAQVKIGKRKSCAEQAWNVPFFCPAAHRDGVAAEMENLAPTYRRRITVQDNRVTDGIVNFVFAWIGIRTVSNVSIAEQIHVANRGLDIGTPTSTIRSDSDEDRPRTLLLASGRQGN
jgi:hypothetical protein